MSVESLFFMKCVCLICRFALGDARRPLHETAALVEDIVHTQLINLVRLNIILKPSDFISQ